MSFKFRTEDKCGSQIVSFAPITLIFSIFVAKTEFTRFEDKTLRRFDNKDKPQVVQPWSSVKQFEQYKQCKHSVSTRAVDRILKSQIKSDLKSRMKSDLSD